MKIMHEAVKTTIRLTSHQKAILATMAQDEGGEVADDVISSDVNLAGAKKQLERMKMISNVQQDMYAMTDLGKKYAINDNIVDEEGTLTQEGEAFVIGNHVTESVKPMSFKDYLIAT